MKAFKYYIEVSEGPIAAVHGMSHWVKEMFVPDLGLYVNEEGGAFVENAERLDFALKNIKTSQATEVDLPPEQHSDLEELKKAILLVEELKPKAKGILSRCNWS